MKELIQEHDSESSSNEELSFDFILQPKTKTAQSSCAHKGEGFSSDEHTDIGNRAFVNFWSKLDRETRALIHAKAEKSRKNGPYYSLKLTDDLQISAGDVVALAGDFFGVPNEPISFGASDNERERRFENAYKTLLKPAYHEQILHLRKYIAEQGHVSTHGLSLMFEKVADENKDSSFVANLKYIFKTINQDDGLWSNRYLKLSFTNFDHFGKDAELAFEAGHQTAINTAQKAAGEDDAEQKKDLLTQAIVQELFACHFLTDLYASGHIRTPRKELTNAFLGNADLNAIPDLKNLSLLQWRKVISAGYLAMTMHDEDCRNGISVLDANGNSWDASGDGTYFNEEYADNAQRVQEAVIAGLNQVIIAYKQAASLELSGNEKLFSVKDFLKKYIPLDDDVTNQTQHPPLFKVENNTVKMRIEGKNGYYYENLLGEAKAYRGLFTVKAKTASQQMIESVDAKVDELLNRLDNILEKCKDSAENINELSSVYCRIL